MLLSQSLRRLLTILDTHYLPLTCLTRTSTPGGDLLFEHNEQEGICQLDERFLQALWNEQPLAQALTTVSGQTVKVLEPGRWNLEPGPDFRDAVIELDGEVLCGDVEIHRSVKDWFRHGHDADRRYADVMLHVVWRADHSDADDQLPPCLQMAPFFDRALASLSNEIGRQGYPRSRQFQAGACAEHVARLADPAVRDLLKVAGLARFREKVADLRRRIIAHGADQACYESLFDALGYKVNREPFRQLASALPIQRLRQLADAETRGAALFGVAGLLPDPTRVELPTFTSRLAATMWDRWWPLGLARLDLPWVRATSRPMNAPERRLAAGIEVLTVWDWQPAGFMRAMIERSDTSAELLQGLMRGLDVHSLWEGYVHFSRRLRKPARLLGRNRQRDILVNVLLPFMRALLPPGIEEPEGQKIERAYLAAPRLQSCRPMDETMHRLFVPPSRGKALARTACEQQGLLALRQHFCRNWRTHCQHCPLGKAGTLAKALSTG